jgi:sortase A
MGMMRKERLSVAKDRLLWLQRLFIGTGVLLVAVWASAWVHSSFNSQSDLAAFEAAKAALVAQARAEPAPAAMASAEEGGAIGTAAAGAGSSAVAATAATTSGFAVEDDPDTTLWSPGRIDDYQASLQKEFDPPEGVLRIPAISLAVPVLQGTDDLTLNRAVGRIPGTARIGATKGNLGIAGHRDSFFRGLKDIGPGETIELETLWNRLTYEVTDITITTPSDVTVLQRSDEGQLTLVTCYPFYFVGHAPKRYIVTAKLVDKETT